MNDEFSARCVTAGVVTALERRREVIASDEALVREELEGALLSLRAAYASSLLPPSYFVALEDEIRKNVPGRWRAAAETFSALERRGFGSWRGGDIYARVTYLFSGLFVGGVCVALPFIPIWEKWFPFALAFVGWWLPDLQAAWHRRRYERELGKIVEVLASRQTALEACVTLGELAAADGEERK